MRKDATALDIANEAGRINISSEIEKTKLDEAPPTLPAISEKKLKLIGETYNDLLSILKEDNNCSRFFGGYESVIIVLNKLVDQVERARFSSSDIGLRMSGEFINYQNYRTKRSYRLFESVSLNSIGPYYNALHPFTGARLKVGPYLGNTREARALMFLHELGHLVMGPDGKWLLADDGHNSWQSERNSYEIDQICREQIKALGKKRKNPFSKPEQLMAQATTKESDK